MWRAESARIPCIKLCEVNRLVDTLKGLVEQRLPTITTRQLRPDWEVDCWSYQWILERLFDDSLMPEPLHALPDPNLVKGGRGDKMSHQTQVFHPFFCGRRQGATGFAGLSPPSGSVAENAKSSIDTECEGIRCYECERIGRREVGRYATYWTGRWRQKTTFFRSSHTISTWRLFVTLR